MRVLAGQVPRDVRLVVSLPSDFLQERAQELTPSSSAPHAPRDRWLDLSATACTHALDVLSISAASLSTRHISVSPRERADAAEAAANAEAANGNGGASLVWIQTSVFVHYECLRRFELDMPASWQLEARCVSHRCRPSLPSVRQRSVD